MEIDPKQIAKMITEDPDEVNPLDNIEDEYEKSPCDEGCDDCMAWALIHRCDICDGCYCRRHWPEHLKREILASRDEIPGTYVTPDGQALDDKTAKKLGQDSNSDGFHIFNLVTCDGGQMFFDAL